MAKGDDAVRKKQNKVKRKKLHNKNDRSSSAISARVASIIAAKKRRHSGKRRKCQGMCFSLPTLDDPFNDRNGAKDFEKKATKKPMVSHKHENVILKEKSKEILDTEMVDGPAQKKEMVTVLKDELKKSLASINTMAHRSRIDPGNTKIQLDGNGGIYGHQGKVCENLDCPSKYLIQCLNAIENSLRCDGTYDNEEDKPLFVSTWGVEFWKCYSAGKDILETSRTSSKMEQIAWMVSCTADSVSRKDEEGLSVTSPFLLFLVPSQEKATKVRSVCKPLKALGIHTVSIHPGASLDHQIEGLKSSEPEIMISTPERLLELLSLKAIDLSGVSLLVIDGLESFYSEGCLDKINSIRQSINGKTHTVVFNDCHRYACVRVVQNLLTGSVRRLSLNSSLTSQSACIIQSVNMCLSKEKLPKAIGVLDQAYRGRHQPQASKVLYIVGKDDKYRKLATALKFKGYSVTSDSVSTEVENSVEMKGRTRPAVSMIDIDQIGATDFSEYECVVLPDLTLSIDSYVQILTRMARYSVNGVLHSFFAREDAKLAAPLIKILEQCGQAVPEALRKMSSS
ncbi:DEAD-box ATP-dependent RNA helicase 40-like [Malus sylvestris]|uniref:DEAD-box ATP-dependent RNA helicase 40-like n=1 Tax=Malus sylvestris TaxID=3752 RepID=UPI0021AC6CA5|nr:DEAD-box ATP-dependent RNA helicase 40-like [Malus sylvestris]